MLISLWTLLSLPAVAAHAEEIDVVNRPINTSGLTGLLITTSPYTLPPGTVEIGASVLSENSIKPDFTITEYPISAAVGLSEATEFGFRLSYYNITEGPTGTQIITRKTGDLELSYKWKFLPHPEDSLLPGFALIIGGKVPTEDSSDLKTTSVSHWSANLGLTAGSEISWKDHVLGIYADGRIVGQDLSDEQRRDMSWMFNAGVLFPISKHQNLQMFIEYSVISGKDFTTLSGGDYNTFAYGLRLVTERFNLTIGSQYLHKKLDGYDNSGRVMGSLSIKL